MVMDLVMVTAPKPPGSRQLISPAGAVLEMAPAKVLHGAVRLQGLASSPTPETQVRVAWAWAGAEARNGRNNPRVKANKATRRMIYLHNAVRISQLKAYFVSAVSEAQRRARVQNVLGKNWSDFLSNTKLAPFSSGFFVNLCKCLRKARGKINGFAERSPYRVPYPNG
jgi:hypothetical protein